MRIVILGGYQKNRYTGVGKYVHDLSDMLNKAGCETKIVYEKFTTGLVSRLLERFVFLPLRLHKLSKDVALTILPDESYSFLLPSISSTKKSIIIHDVRPLSLVGGGYLKVRELFLKFQNFTFLRIADIVIVPSDFTRQCVGRGLVIPNVFDTSLEKHESFLPEELKKVNYLLYVGTNQLRKNFATADTVAVKAKEKYNLEFVCIGNVQPSNGKKLQKLTDKELAAVYQHAFVLINPSLFEGFGRVVIEAQINGCPVISTSCSALEEVLEASALMVKDPKDAIEYLRYIEALFDCDLRKDVKNQGFKNSKRFDKNFTDLKPLLDQI